MTKDYERRYRAEKRKSDNLPKGLYVGKLVKFQVADGYAFYKVTKIGKNICELTWLDLHPDGWKEPTLGSHGILSTERLKEHINFQENLDNAFKSNKSE